MSTTETVIQAKLGQQITIEFEMTSACLDKPVVAKYTGTVLRSERWDPPNSFRMEGDKNFPVRVVDYKCVKGVDGGKIEKVSPAATTKQTYVVPNSKGTGEYVVTFDRNTEKYTCTCAGFSFRKTCSHVNRIAEQTTASVG